MHGRRRSDVGTHLITRDHEHLVGRAGAVIAEALAERKAARQPKKAAASVVGARYSAIQVAEAAGILCR